MTENRPLTPEEKQRYEEAVRRLEEEKEYQLFVKANKTRSLEFGLEIEFKAIRRQVQAELKTAEQELREIEFALNDCKDKLENGVPPLPTVTETPQEE